MSTRSLKIRFTDIFCDFVTGACVHCYLCGGVACIPYSLHVVWAGRPHVAPTDLILHSRCNGGMHHISTRAAQRTSLAMLASGLAAAVHASTVPDAPIRPTLAAATADIPHWSCALFATLRAVVPHLARCWLGSKDRLPGASEAGHAVLSLLARLAGQAMDATGCFR